MTTRTGAICFVLCCGLLGAALLLSAPASANTIDVDKTLSTADEPGLVDVRTDFSLPGGTTSFEVTLPEDAEMVETSGFTRTGDRTYEWTRTTTEPSIRYDFEGNVTIDRGGVERHIYAMTDEWGLVRTPNEGLRWSGVTAEVRRNQRVDGEGIAGPHITFLGPHEELVRQTDGERFRLVVPEAATMAEDPDDVLDVLEHAAGRLGVGDRSDEVLVVAAPTGEIEWGATGVQRGDADMWVRDVERLDTARNVWVHEYVHVRQRYDATDETVWTFEGMADYYAALIPYEEGEIDYAAFRDRMAVGASDRYSDVRLADRDSWAGTEADYDKGALVFSHLDRLLRVQADTSIDAVVAELNVGDAELTQTRFLEIVETHGGSELRAEAERYTETTETPPVWSREQHQTAFGGADVRYAFDAFAVGGPYRESSLDEPHVVSGETLEATVRVENVGAQAGDYDTTVTVGGEPVDELSGMIQPGQSTTHAISVLFDEPGTHEIVAGTASATVVVDTPADPEVVGLAVEPSEARLGESVRLQATVRSTANRPADGEIVFVVDGETVATERARVGTGETIVETTTAFDDPGTYEIDVDGHTATVTVIDETPTPGGETQGLTPTAAGGAGFGAATALVAIVALGLASGLRRRRGGW